MTDSQAPPDGRPRTTSTPSLSAAGITVSYDGAPVVHGLDLEVLPGELTVIVGPNGCGKSTVLRTLARLLRPDDGSVLLDGTDIHRLKTIEVARRLALLPQNQTIPSGVTVADLVGRGRFAHQGFLRRFSAEDEVAVQQALEDTGLSDLADRPVDSLSGGQRQCAWFAVVLAQDTPLLLLDEPTTYLDIGHQMEVLELCRKLHAAGRTVVAVLHDLAHAARFATHVIALRDGRLHAQGGPREVFTPEVVEGLFGWPCHVFDDPVSGAPLIIPRDSGAAR